MRVQVGEALGHRASDEQCLGLLKALRPSGSEHIDGRAALRKGQHEPELATTYERREQRRDMVVRAPTHRLHLCAHAAESALPLEVNALDSHKLARLGHLRFVHRPIDTRADLCEQHVGAGGHRPP